MKINNDKRYLITGGTGSFGKEFIKYLIAIRKVSPEQITILSRDEQKQYQMQQNSLYQDCKYEIHDVRDADGMLEIIKGHNIVVNTAAIKHVSKAQDYVMEAIKTNILGPYNLMTAIQGLTYPITFVHLSTDKSVEPINYYGATKMLSEGLVRNFSQRQSPHKFFSARYGNIVLSEGGLVKKVATLFRNNSPVFLTHQNMTRFLMSFDDAIDVVMAACSGTHEQSGKIFVPLNLPSCFIRELLEILKEELDSKSEIIVGGISEGEKIDEALLNREEAFEDNLDIVTKTRSGYPIACVRIKDKNRGSKSNVYSSGLAKHVLTKENLKQYLLDKGIVDYCRSIN